MKIDDLKKFVNIKLMEIISHRVNTVEQMLNTPKEYGVELDLRNNSLGGEIVITHEPENAKVSTANFDSYLYQYGDHGTLILNIKEEGIEEKCLQLLKKHNIKDYFFLDCSFPMINKLITKYNENNIALRFSEFEGLDTIRNMAGKCKWVWVDTFNTNPLTKEIADEIHSLGYKICFVSPELQGRPEDKELYMEEVKDYVDAVCTDL